MPAPVEAPADPPVTDQEISNALSPWHGDLDGMVRRRYVRLLVTFSRTNYFIDRAVQRGATYDAGKLFEKHLNSMLKTGNTPVHVMFIPVSRDRIIEDLAAGRGDLAAANLTITPQRSALVDFSPPILDTVREVVVTSADVPPLKSLEDLSGMRVHVRRSSSYYETLEALNQSLRGRGLPLIDLVDAPTALEDEDLLEMVNAGLVNATVVDDYLAEFWGKVFDGIQIHELSLGSDREIAWAIRRDTPQLHEAVKRFIYDNPQGSKSFNLIFQQYFRNTRFITNAASAAEMEKFKRIEQLFQTYGQKYELPWLLVAAQGFQESQLEQNTRSHAGAVGVMQIKPSTAAGWPINIRGVDTSTDRNIEAGIKYLRFIVDQYFDDAPMDRLNKGLFAIASYNAGPARVAALRRKAAAMGLDPNKWFGNVEIVAAREIGRETVTYVANIYKYYVAYDLFLQQADARRRRTAPLS